MRGQLRGPSGRRIDARLSPVQEMPQTRWPSAGRVGPVKRDWLDLTFNVLLGLGAIGTLVLLADAFH